MTNVGAFFPKLRNINLVQIASLPEVGTPGTQWGAGGGRGKESNVSEDSGSLKYLNRIRHVQRSATAAARESHAN